MGLSKAQLVVVLRARTKLTASAWVPRRSVLLGLSRVQMDAWWNHLEFVLLLGEPTFDQAMGMQNNTPVRRKQWLTHPFSSTRSRSPSTDGRRASTLVHAQSHHGMVNPGSRFEVSDGRRQRTSVAGLAVRFHRMTCGCWLLQVPVRVAIHGVTLVRCVVVPIGDDRLDLVPMEGPRLIGPAFSIGTEHPKVLLG